MASRTPIQGHPCPVVPAIKNGYALLVIAPGDIASQILFAGWRFVLAGIILLGAGVAMRKAVISLDARGVRQVALLGLTQTAVQYVFFYIGLDRSAALVFVSIGIWLVSRSPKLAGARGR